ncbi:MAG: 16S rRNA (guanine(966)-N(2))-methyltransferase RsmD [Candidatus Zapsychrus exili]|nr:16S rRNA (guanine(966)-N(2))-methyltransferase RsmD [Candidatus Zapsychrus exili]
MKITGGKYKNRNIYISADIRPTQHVTRKAIFDILGHDFEGLRVLELCAGSGAIGIEALSRGAREVVFVEKDPKVYKIIHDNLDILSVSPNEEGDMPYETMNLDMFVAIKMLAKKGEKFDVIVFDPPYGRELAKKVLKTLDSYDILHRNCILVAQHPKDEALPEEEGRFLIFKQKKYGRTLLSLYKIKDN